MTTLEMFTEVADLIKNQHAEPSLDSRPDRDEAFRAVLNSLANYYELEQAECYIDKHVEQLPTPESSPMYSLYAKLAEMSGMTVREFRADWRKRNALEEISVQDDLFGTPDFSRDGFITFGKFQGQHVSKLPKDYYGRLLAHYKYNLAVLNNQRRK